MYTMQASDFWVTIYGYLIDYDEPSFGEKGVDESRLYMRIDIKFIDWCFDELKVAYDRSASPKPI